MCQCLATGWQIKLVDINVFICREYQEDDLKMTLFKRNEVFDESSKLGCVLN